jgi:hypothetical protein
MMTPIEIIAQDLFDKVRSRFSNLQMGDAGGSVTANPKDARFFDFDFSVEGHDLGRVSISINDVGNLKIFFSQGIAEKSDSIATSMWYDFLKEMRFFAKRRLLRFDTRDITKGNLDKTDFQYLAQKDANMTESTMFGSSKTSHRKLEDTDLIIRHSEAIDPTKPGARSRKIKNLFIQNKEGERFKFPFVYLPGARAMQRHVANGGYPHDDSGKKIIKTCEEILKLSDFGRKVKHSTLNDNANQIAERATQKLQQLRHHMECMSKQGYYQEWIEAQQDAEDPLIELDDATFESYKSTFTISKFDEALAEVFPILHAIMQETSELDLENYVKDEDEDSDINEESNNVDEFSTFESWTNDIVSEVFSDNELKQLEPLVQEPLLIGANDEAVQALAGIGIKDPELVNALRAIADMPNGADADARPTIKAYLGSEADRMNWGDMSSDVPALPEPQAAPEPAPEEMPAEEPGMEEPAPEEMPAEEPGMEEPAPEEMPAEGYDSIELDPTDKLIEPDSKKGKLRKVAEIVMGFYNRQDGTWTKGEHGVVTHVKRHFSDDGKGGEKEAHLAVELIKHINGKNESASTIAEMRRLAGLK